ncbi:XK-related protein 8-like [Sardina pilchardus]|uniref:XK-related protein 8-like n=1 Tax=Sardina pilchardus TaxID=27697 RepID=UPI002E167B80
MEDGIPFFYPFSDFGLNITGLLFFLLDLVLDIWAVVTFYQEEAYVNMGVLIFLLVGSSVLLQAFSWLWYNYGSKEEKEGLGKYVYLEKYLYNRRLLGVLHVCQLGVFLRFASMMEISLRNMASRDGQKEGIAVFLTHDLSLLRLIETFSESAPQLTLMLAIIAHREDVEWVTGLKTLGSFAAIAFSVVMYHRAMRSFSEDKAQMTWMPSLVYFLWNFLLIAPRLAAVALAASTLPVGMIAVHFLLLWITFVLWAWRQKTDFMDTPTGERLYRGTVALIWYFCWFNVSHYDSRGRSIIYHFIIAVDSAILLGLWWWDCFQASVFGMPGWAVFICAGSSYIVGIIVKILYYKLCHPKKSATIDKSDTEESEDILPPQAACLGGEIDEVDFCPSKATGMDEVDVGPLKAPSPPPPPKPLTGAQKRMRKLADNFYS